jgi:hypothetical protein
MHPLAEACHQDDSKEMSTRVRRGIGDYLCVQHCWAYLGIGKTASSENVPGWPEYEVATGILGVVRVTLSEMVGEDETSGLENCWVGCRLDETVEALAADCS